MRITEICRWAALAALLQLGATLADAQQIARNTDGITVTAGGVTLKIKRSRDDILRVRMWRADAVPEDASWAVLPASRTSSVAVIAEPQGFATHALRVRVDEHLQLTVTDLQGNVLQKDAAPVLWEGNRFTVAKQRTYADHFFGLGDKPGPLDRAGEAFTMWNTDSFGWQESTDPIYKSIPFFLTVNHGRSLGRFSGRHLAYQFRFRTR